ncbi:PREDICTED: uncharacterized protein LOC109358029 [Lupinus angustifolius]|uniref:uncharacterized protein LOC109358029 n=1 Tax=Lupinus angustifolius TaxID=3871 RepID=UPI00092E6A5D|nr:PREDICTED: uncharacterized protein LOC109358029 [Lupinus angustifolius]
MKSAFLNGPLEEVVFVNQPPGFISKGNDDKKCSIMYMNSLYHNGGVLFICLCVDDLLITGSSSKGIKVLKSSLNDEFEMTELGILSFFLSLEFQYTEKGLFVHQRKYMLQILIKFNMLNCNTSETLAKMNLKMDHCENEATVDATLFRQIVRSLWYICHSRPKISFSVGMISKFMSNPRHSHMIAAKRILRYLRETLDFGIVFPHQDEKISSHLVVFSDSHWCGDVLDRKNTMWYVFMIVGASISSKKKKVVALSTCEVEYIAACHTACQALWISSLLLELDIESEDVIELLIDSKSTIDLTKNHVSHGRSKHIKTKYHVLRHQVAEGRIKLVHYKIEAQLANIMTKSLKMERSRELRKKIGIQNLKD